ncbi:MAG: class I SAM-dependent methyltransferase [Blautia sp.]|jgi:precorrin-6B methylase 2
MNKYVGRVLLDDTYYPGEDLYSDGAVEDEMLELASSYEEGDFNREIDRRKSWPILYHFSHIRENIANWLPLTKEDKVLEVGAGCGAVTGALAAKAGHVTCIDLSMKRSLINANRHKNASNIEILVGNFQDIEKNLKETYDYITLIGVFEYSEGYIGGENPYVEMLQKITSHLKPDGKIVIAIENRLGMKYWAGCTEDHNGLFFQGLEGYPDTHGVKTFSKMELEGIFAAAGAYDCEFYYPYPDYKFPMTIYSDEWLPGIGELREVNYNFDRARLRLFDETRVYDTVIANGLYPVYANSYLVVAKPRRAEEETAKSATEASGARSVTSVASAAEVQGGTVENAAPEIRPEAAVPSAAEVQADAPADSALADAALPAKGLARKERILYVKHSNERDPRFAIRTEILEGDDGRRRVRKVAETKAGEAHLNHIHKSYQLLKGLYRGTAIEMNRCEKENGAISLEYLTGTTLEEMLDALLEDKQIDKLWETLNGYLDVLRKAGGFQLFVPTEKFTEVFGRVDLPDGLVSADVSNIDCICSNLLWNQEKQKWQMLDYEWTFAFPIPVNFLIYRVLNYYLYTSTMRNVLLEEDFFGRAGLTNVECLAYRQMEINFQRYITGRLVPMRDMYDAISPGTLIDMKNRSWEKQCFTDCLQVFVDYGEDFSEENAWLLPCRDGFFEDVIPVPEGAKRIRLDPTDRCCIVKLRCLTAEQIQGVSVPEKKLTEEDFLEFTTNGWKYGPGEYFFDNEDPQIVIDELPPYTKGIALAYEVTACDSAMASMVRRQLEEKRALETELSVCQQELCQKKELIQAMENTKVWKLYRSIKKD